MKKKQEEIQTPIELAVIPMAICKTEAFTALNGAKVTQEHIQHVLDYDPSYRMAYLYLNPASAHNHSGETNRPVLGRFTKKHYVKDGFIYGDVELQLLYPSDASKQKTFEKDIITMVSDKGGYPSRSLDLIPYTDNTGKVKYLFDGVAAVGSQKAAIPNLPTIDHAELLNLNGLSFSLNLNGEPIKEIKKMEMDEAKVLELIKKEKESWEKESSQKLELALGKQKEELTASFEKQNESIRKQNEVTQRSLAKKEATLFFSQEDIQKKVFSTQKENGAAILLALEELPEAKIELSMYDAEGKKESTKSFSLAESFKQFVSSLPDYVELSQETEGNETHIKDIPDKGAKVLFNETTKQLTLKGDNTDEQRFNLIRDAAKELKLSLADEKTYVENFEKAEAHAIRLSLDSKNAKHLFTKQSEVNLSKELEN